MTQDPQPSYWVPGPAPEVGVRVPRGKAHIVKAGTDVTLIRCSRAVIVHEAVKPFGVGAEIAARINEELFGQLLARVERVGGFFLSGDPR